MAEVTLPSTREEALRWLRDEWGWPNLAAIVRYVSTPPRYVARLEGGQAVDLGTAESLLNQHRLRQAVFGSTHHLLRWVDKRYWDDVVRIIATASEDREAPESEEFDWLRGLLESYLEERKPATEDDIPNWQAHHRMELPLVYKGEVLINSVNLAAWAADVRGSKVRPRDLALILRRYGAEPVRPSVREGGSVRNRRYWQLPASLTPENASWTNVSAVSGSFRDPLTLTNPVQDDENDGCKRVSGLKCEGEQKSETSAYTLTSEENTVQDAKIDVSGSEKHPLTALTSVQDEKNDDSKRVSSSKTQNGQKIETSAYTLTSEENIVQDAKIDVSASEKHPLTALTFVQDEENGGSYVDL